MHAQHRATCTVYDPGNHELSSDGKQRGTGVAKEERNFLNGKTKEVRRVEKNNSEGEKKKSVINYLMFLRTFE